jgi:hypothetical protein
MAMSKGRGACDSVTNFLGNTIPSDVRALFLDLPAVKKIL